MAGPGEPSSAKEAASSASRRQKFAKVLRPFRSKSTPPKSASENTVTTHQRQTAPKTSLNLPKVDDVSVSFPDGIKVLHDCPDARVDVCFIHGLAGDREKTWTAEGESQPWPQTLLPSHLESARILTFGYDAYVVRVSSAARNSLRNHAANLLKDLTDVRASGDTSARPIIFVAHSLGGLVCKKALLLSRNNREAHLQSIFKTTRGIAFMGTPHRGSWAADWAKLPASVLGCVKIVNKNLLETLRTDNELLRDTREGFASMIQDLSTKGQGINIACFYEELPLSSLGRFIVSQDSATLEGYSSFAIHADHRGMVRFFSAEDTGFKRLLGELIRWSQMERIRAESFSRPVLSELDKACLSSLAFPEMISRFNDIESAFKNTCEWLFQHKTYTDWEASDRKLLWIKGKPGAGKSTLLRNTLDRISNLPFSGIRSPLILSFFFHGRGGELQKSPLGLFRSLLHQIITEIPDAAKDLVAIFQRRYDTMGRAGEKWNWHAHELQLFLQKSLPQILKIRTVWIFVDALDECGEQNAVDLAEEFRSTLCQLPSTDEQCRICFTCRHYPILSLESASEICVETENGQDIKTYVLGQLTSCNAPDTIVEAIVNRASGVFMWTHLVLQTISGLLRTGAGWKKIESKILETPADLDRLYEDLVKSMDDTEASLKLFQWICFAEVTLSLEQLRWALIVDANCPYKSLQDCETAEEYDCDMEKKLKTLSCGLVEITSGGGRKLAQLIHQSVKDFLISKGLRYLQNTKADAAETTDVGSTTAMAHYQISRSCIRYIAMEEIARLDSFDSLIFPLLLYIAKYLVKHITESETLSTTPDDLLAFFGWPSEHLIQLLARLEKEIDERWYGTSGSKKDSNTTMLHLSVQLQLKRPIRVILEDSSSNIDAKDDKGRTPLSYAVYGGSEAINRQLLDTGMIEADSKCNDGRTPLSYAAEAGKAAVVKQLLDTGMVEADSRCENGRTPLSYAAEAGKAAVVEQLLDTGMVEADSRCENGRTPLSYASSVAVAKLLLGTGCVSANTKDVSGRPPLCHAVMLGDSAVVGYLLTLDWMDAKCKDKKGWTVLMHASRAGDVAMVRQLLESGRINANTRDSDGQTALFLAVIHRNYEVLKLLLTSSQVEIDAKDALGRTALSLAVEKRNKVALSLLLQSGADHEVIDIAGRRPMMLAAAKKDVAIVQLLLLATKSSDGEEAEFGAPLLREIEQRELSFMIRHLSKAYSKLDANNIYFGEVLLWAAKAGYADVIELLLRIDGINVNAKGRNRTTALMLSAVKGHAEVVRLLLAVDGIDVNAKNWIKTTALIMAAEGGCEEVVKLLLAMDGIDVNTKSWNGFTALITAAVRGHKEVVKLLLAVDGIDVNAKDWNANTALIIAARRGYEEVVKLLLAVDGIDITCKDIWGSTALGTAEIGGHFGVVTLLEQA